MRKFKKPTGYIPILAAFIILTHLVVLSAEDNRQWDSPFSINPIVEFTGDTLTFEQVLARVGQANELLQSARILREGVSGLNRCLSDEPHQIF